jgi:D-alanine-D-alanine ligase
MGRIIGLTYNLKSDWKFSPDDPVDAAAELDGITTVESIERALKKGGHSVKRIGSGQNLLKQLPGLDVDIVFNICEGFRGRNREAEVPVILEMHQIPFIGADGLTLAVTLDKVVAKKCFVADGVPTAKFFRAYQGDDLKKLNTIGFPLMVKTSQEGTSKGLTPASRVENFNELKKQVDIINTLYKQPALVEQFISGTEFTVPVIGNKNPQAMPVVQYCMGGALNLGDQFYTYQHVVDKSVEYLCPAKIPASFAKKLQEVAVAAYKSVDCRDFGRVDFRVDKEGNPYVLEINPLPNLSEEEVFGLFPKVVGTTYAKVINQIVEFALERYGQTKEESLVK